MKKVILLVLLFVSTTSLYGQYWVVKGTVVDSADQVPLFAATVVIKNLVDATFKVKVTDQTGAFRLTSIENGNYEFSISFVGYRTFKELLEIKDGSFDFKDNTTWH